jgi:hypothetical protein
MLTSSYSMENQLTTNILMLVLLAWTIFWKGLALWRAAKHNQKNWFIIMLILGFNTLGILEIIYLFRFSQKRMTFNELKDIFRNLFYTKTSK